MFLKIRLWLFALSYSYKAERAKQNNEMNKYVAYKALMYAAAGYLADLDA